jgi:hypothetical protein
LKKLSIPITVLALIVVTVVLIIVRRPQPALWIRISGVARSLSPNGMGDWRVEVPKPPGRVQGVECWRVSIEETNSVAVEPTPMNTVARHHLFNWISLPTESGIHLLDAGPKLDSNKVYRAIGVFSPPLGSWAIRVYESPLRPLMRLVPEPTPQYATSEWVRVQFPEGVAFSQAGQTKGLSAASPQAK